MLGIVWHSYGQLPEQAYAAAEFAKALPQILALAKQMGVPEK